MKIAYRVQHAAGRDAALERLLAKLPPAVEVVADHEWESDPNPWRNYRRCLEDLPNGVSHVCVLQDDALPCRDFGMRLNEALEEKPHDLVSLFVGGLKGHSLRSFRQAQARKERWCVLPRPSRIVHVVALVWPVGLAADFLAWYDEEQDNIPSPQPHRSDDMLVSYWLKTSKPWQTVWATVPCLVEHPDDLPSVAQRHDKGGAGRRAIAFADTS